jgi:hypothetical protein
MPAWSMGAPGRQAQFIDDFHTFVLQMSDLLSLNQAEYSGCTGKGNSPRFARWSDSK